MSQCDNCYWQDEYGDCDLRDGIGTPLDKSPYGVHGVCPCWEEKSE